MSVISKIFSKVTGDIIKETGGVIDTLSTSDAEKLKAKEELSKIVMDGLNTATSFQRDVLVKEMEGNFLQRSWRPLTLLTFTVVVVISVFTDTHLNEVPTEFWDLISLGLGGYVAGRSVEKVAKTVTKNVDLSMIRKKDRKGAI